MLAHRLWAETVEADVAALAAASAEALHEMRGHTHALRTATEHLFLAEAPRLRQRLLPAAEAACARLENVATAASALQVALQSGASVEVLRALTGSGLGGDGGDGSGSSMDGSSDDLGGALGAAASVAEDPSGGTFTDEQLAWGRKEARAKLEPEAFKAWRREVKRLSKKMKGGGGEGVAAGRGRGRGGDG
jgi:hypothetical protein